MGTAVNRSQATGAGGRRNAEQVAQEVALVMRQFNQVTAENDMKWQLIHPREGADGYDFGPADSFVNFGLSIWLEIIGPDFIAKAFQYAHEADPDAILRYNDYGLENPVKIQKLVTLIRSLQEQKVPIHAIGTQAHLNVSTAGFEMVTFWSVNDAVSWRAKGKPLLFDGDNQPQHNQPKAAFDAVIAEAKKAAEAR